MNFLLKMTSSKHCINVYSTSPDTLLILITMLLGSILLLENAILIMLLPQSLRLKRDFNRYANI